LASAVLKTDLDDVFESVSPHWEKLRGKRIFLTGGTGFFGSWLLETLIEADRRLGLGVEVTVLTRNATAFRARRPHLAGSSIVRSHTGDIRDFGKPSGSFTHVIHAATEVANYADTSPADVMDSIVQGTRRVLEIFRGERLESFLYVSSGAVYGLQSPETAYIDEDSAQAPLTTAAGATYGHAKRLAEHLCFLEPQLPFKIARCFAFIGPYMPFESHLAAGAFIKTAQDREDIQITGNGTNLRSYLYAADLAAWLWTILLAGKSGSVLNVGSDVPISIHDLAVLTQSLVNPRGAVHVAKTAPAGALPPRYVPSISRASKELGLSVKTSLSEAIRRTADWRAKQVATETSPS
jgi:nucleoside-diphosphate-sugar epimerase